MSVLASGLDFSPGHVTFAEELPLLKEDLLQVEYPEGHLIDVGWYSEGNIEGAFNVLIVVRGDWEQPLLSLSARREEHLNPLLLQSIAFVREKLSLF